MKGYLGGENKPINYASDVDNDSSVTGATVKDALETLAATGTGDVYGPAGAVDSNFASFNTTTGKLIKDSGKKPADFELVSNKENTTLDTSTTKYPTNNLVKTSIANAIAPVKNTVIVTRTTTRVPKITKIETLLYTYNMTIDPNGGRTGLLNDGTNTWTPTRVRAGGSVVSVA